jgi:hypothetical protein
MEKQGKRKWWQRRSTVMPAMFLVYTAVMAWLGRAQAATWEYWAVVVTCVAANVALHVALRRREHMRRRDK